MADEAVAEPREVPALDRRDCRPDGMLNLPTPDTPTPAHANGVRSLGCIFFSDNDRGDQTGMRASAPAFRRDGEGPRVSAFGGASVH
ncbi:hypothetical protein [Nonomuraea sp. NPDC049400]|uniref:hypothetical protein n=1 Tax=Nonomuraea sp. NPDC049400 TaxID=3364352 RepID=UPI0037A5AB2D